MKLLLIWIYTVFAPLVLTNNLTELDVRESLRHPPSSFELYPSECSENVA